MAEGDGGVRRAAAGVRTQRTLLRFFFLPLSDENRAWTRKNFFFASSFYAHSTAGGACWEWPALMAGLVSGLLEGVVASLLTKYLGQYIDGLSKENLNMSLGSGEPEALDQLELPIRVHAGALGKLSLSIPWKQLKSKPAIIRLERVFLLAGPKIPKEVPPRPSFISN